MRIITATANNVGARPGSECVEGLEPSTPSWSQSPTQPLPREKVWGWQSQGPTTGQPAFSQSASGGAREGPTQSCRSPEDPVAAGRPGFAPVPKRRELAKGTSWKKCWCLPSPDTLPSNYTSLQVPCEKIMGQIPLVTLKIRGTIKGLLKMLTWMCISVYDVKAES